MILILSSFLALVKFVHKNPSKAVQFSRVMYSGRKKVYSAADIRQKNNFSKIHLKNVNEGDI
jgi:hypothetical protein